MKHTLFTCAKWMRLKYRMPEHMECTLVGALEMLFHFGNANGDVLNACDVEAVCGWTQEQHAGKLLTALTDTGGGAYTNFLDVLEDGRVRIHGFWEHAPDCVKNRKRQQEHREQMKRNKMSQNVCDSHTQSQNVCYSNDKPKPKPKPNDVYKKEDNTLLIEKAETVDSPKQSRGVVGNDVFDTFWKAYPRKVNKPGALKAWKNKKLNDSIDIILAGLERWKASRQWVKDGGQFIPHPATWINQERWNDDVDSDSGYQLPDEEDIGF